MNNAPIDKGRVCFVAEKFQDRNNPNETKNRYATLGRATKWPSDNGGSDRVDIELDSMPIGQEGKLKLFIFWDSESQQQISQQPQYNQNAQMQQPPAHMQQQPPQGYPSPQQYQRK